MNTRVEFKSSAFPKYPDEESETVNPGHWGKRLAEYVRDNLPRYGVQTTGILCEDWGWVVNTSNADFPVWIGWGSLDDVVGAGNGLDPRLVASATGETEFAMSVTAEPGFLQRLFKRVDSTTIVQKTSEAVKAMIDASPDFREATWSE